MTSLHKPTPRQLVRQIYGSVGLGLLSVSLFTLSIQQRAPHLWELLALLPLPVGVTLCWLLHRQLRRGILNVLWSDAQLEDGYQAVRNRSMTAFLLVGFLVYVVLSGIYLLQSRPHHHDSPAVFLVFLQWPSLMMNSLARLLKPYQAPELPADPPTLPRLYSAHWGEPPTNSF